MLSSGSMEMLATAQLIPAAVPAMEHSAPKAAPLPQIIGNAGSGARFAWEEFLHGWVRNPHTRAAYERAIRQFCAWQEMRNSTLTQVIPGLIGRYFDQHPGSIPSKKLALAALRALFDRLVNRHILILNPAATVRGEKYPVTEGRTPERGQGREDTHNQSRPSRGNVGTTRNRHANRYCNCGQGNAPSARSARTIAG